ncbi:diguanylate cyclase [Candidatus Magnetaquicoccus inordinatus]|uniref:diguanylate cyclase n=1 Tax=Candidatus Magnetaquicoccus inordinatus TaxID=2496818 RepID=UPI00102C1F84|nr:diguanylate cyclase [Candidatus Magnetaquicoccus inordinatus]
MAEMLPKILVVDDIAANLLAMRTLLGKLHAEVLVATTGNDALALALDHDLALVLLDVNMPGMDGYEVAEWLRGEDQTRDVPIIFVTAAYKDDAHRLQGYHAGAIDYIEKPVDGRILRSKVSVLLELYRRKQELKWANNALSEHTNMLQTTMDNIRHGLAMFDVELCLRAWNERFFDYPSYPQLLAKQGTPLAEFLQVHELRGEMIRKVADRLADQVVPWRFDWSLANGRILDVKTNPMPGGGLVIALTDVSDQRRDEAAIREHASRLAAVNATAHDAIVTIDRYGKVREWNPAAERMFGYTVKEMRGRSLRRIMPERFLQEHNQGVLRYVQKRESEVVGKTVERIGLRKDGQEFPIELSLAAWGEPSNPFFTAIMRDVTDRKNQEELLLQMNQRLADSLAELQKHHNELLQLSKMNERLQSCASMEEAVRVLEGALLELFKGLDGVLVLTGGEEVFEVAGRWGGDAEGGFPPASCMVKERWQQVAGQREGCSWHGKERGGCCCLPLWEQGKVFGFLHLLEQTEGAHGGFARHSGLLNTVREAIELSLANLRMRERLKDQAVRDVLTGLFNRRYLDETLPRELSRAARAQQPLAVAMVDVDHFKRFNDTFGHDAGDAVLREVAALLRQRMRKSDIACRYGGEEMTVVLPGLEMNAARERMEKIRQEIKALQVVHAGVALGTITVSVGIAEHPRHGTQMEEILRRADAALYTAKQSGRDRVVLAE